MSFHFFEASGDGSLFDFCDEESELVYFALFFGAVLIVADLFAFSSEAVGVVIGVMIVFVDGDVLFDVDYFHFFVYSFFGVFLVELLFLVALVLLSDGGVSFGADFEGFDAILWPGL